MSCWLMWGGQLLLSPASWMQTKVQMDNISESLDEKNARILGWDKRRTVNDIIAQIKMRIKHHCTVSTWKQSRELSQSPGKLTASCCLLQSLDQSHQVGSILLPTTRYKGRSYPSAFLEALLGKNTNILLGKCDCQSRIFQDIFSAAFFFSL